MPAPNAVSVSQRNCALFAPVTAFRGKKRPRFQEHPWPSADFWAWHLTVRHRDSHRFELIINLASHPSPTKPHRQPLGRDVAEINNLPNGRTGTAEISSTGDVSEAERELPSVSVVETARERDTAVTCKCPRGR